MSLSASVFASFVLFVLLPPYVLACFSCRSLLLVAAYFRRFLLLRLLSRLMNKMIFLESCVYVVGLMLLVLVFSTRLPLLFVVLVC